MTNEYSGGFVHAWVSFRRAGSLGSARMADATGKAGVRSLKAYFLRQQGFKYLKSVKGGITAWSEEIDSKVPRY